MDEETDRSIWQDLSKQRRYEEQVVVVYPYQITCRSGCELSEVYQIDYICGTHQACRLPVRVARMPRLQQHKAPSMYQPRHTLLQRPATRDSGKAAIALCKAKIVVSFRVLQSQKVVDVEMIGEQNDR